MTATGVPYAEVIGDPIDHSLSPVIHDFWLGKLGLEASYRRHRVERGGLADYLAGRRDDPNWRGCNVTMPLKLEAMEHADLASDKATNAGAANVLVLRDGELVAENTDVAAISTVLAPYVTSNFTEVCVIGTGGAARATLAAVQLLGGEFALITARDSRAGWQLMEEFRLGGTVRPLDDSHNIQTADIIVNATPLGMKGRPPMPSDLLSYLHEPLPDAVVLDLVTNPVETELIKAARRVGLRTFSGLTVLIEQAAESFRYFYGANPPRDQDASLLERLAQ